LKECYKDGDKRKDLITYVKVEDKVCVMNKFKDLKSATYNTVGNDQIILRYADVLLMYAEALNEISYSNSQTSDAMVALNAVHTRAGLSPVQITELADQDSFRKAIMLERLHRAQLNQLGVTVHAQLGQPGLGFWPEAGQRVGGRHRRPFRPMGNRQKNTGMSSF
jgi:hypothetical protein